jgi:predicted small metal-binding protein
MNKTFTCRELGGTCDEKFSGNTLDEIIGKAMPHIAADGAHMEHIRDMEVRTSETKEQWYERMQEEFDAKAVDA